MRVPPDGQARDEVARELYLAVAVSDYLPFGGALLEELKLRL